MTDLSIHAPLLLAALPLLFAALVLGLAGLCASRLQTQIVPCRQRRTVLLILVAAGLLPGGLGGCGPTAEPLPVVTRVVTSAARDAPTVQPSNTLRATAAAPVKTPEGGAAASIDFVIPDDHLWEKTASNAYSITGEEDTFAWSRQVVKGDFEFSADVESDFANYGEAMVVVYGDGKGWTPGCLIFNITGYWQSIRAHSIYDPDTEWVVQNEEPLDFANRNRYRMTIRVAGDEASLYVDDRMVASTPMFPRFNHEGYIALVKWGGSAPVTFTNIAFKTEQAGEAIAAAPSKTPAATTAPKNTPTSLPPPTNTPAPTPSPRPTSPPTATPPPTNTLVPTPKPSPKPTSPPTATLPPPFRPPTGMLEDRSPGGQGELLIKNGTDADALVILTGLDDQAVKSAYIRNAESFNMTGIQDGTYRLYYSKGEAFNKEANRFAKNATYQRLDATVEFTTSATQYTAWEVTLYGVAGGNVGSEQVDPSKFP